MNFMIVNKNVINNRYYKKVTNLLLKNSYIIVNIWEIKFIKQIIMTK